MILKLPDETSIRCHQVVLSAASPHFHEIIKQAKDHEVKVDFADSDVIKVIVDYLYTGDINITIDNFHDLLAVNQILHLKDLKIRLQHFMKAEIDVSNCVEFYRLSRVHNLDELEPFCMEFLLAHFVEAVSSSESFEQLSESDLVKLLSDDRLNVESEDFVFHSLVRWAYSDIDVRKQTFEMVAEYVRFPYCTQQCLNNAVREPLMMGPTCLEFVHEALSFKSSLLSSASASTPRNLPRHSHEGLKPHLGRVFIGSDSPGEYFVEGQFTADIGTDWEPLFKTTEMNTSDIDFCLSSEEVHCVSKEEKKDHYWSAAEKKVLSSDWMVPERSEFSLLHNGQKILAFGGNIGGDHCSTVESFNSKQKKWKPEAPMPEAVSKPYVVQLESKIYVMGGVSANEACTATQEYNPIWKKWEKKRDMPGPCQGGAVLAFSDSILVVGGKERCCFKYLPEDDVWVEHAQPNDVHEASTAACAWGRRVLLCSENHAEQYDPEKDEWLPCEQLLSAKENDTHHGLRLFNILK